MNFFSISSKTFPLWFTGYWLSFFMPLIYLSISNSSISFSVLVFLFISSGSSLTNCRFSVSSSPLNFRSSSSVVISSWSFSLSTISFLSSIVSLSSLILFLSHDSLKLNHKLQSFSSCCFSPSDKFHFSNFSSKL